MGDSRECKWKKKNHKPKTGERTDRMKTATIEKTGPKSGGEIWRKRAQ